MLYFRLTASMYNETGGKSKKHTVPATRVTDFERAQTGPREATYYMHQHKAARTYYMQQAASSIQEGYI